MKLFQKLQFKQLVEPFVSWIMENGVLIEIASVSFLPCADENEFDTFSKSVRLGKTDESDS